MGDPYKWGQIEDVIDLSARNWNDIEDNLRNAMRSSRNRDFGQSLVHIEEAEAILATMRLHVQTAKDMQESNERVAIAEGRI